MNLSQLVLGMTVFSFMLTAVNLLPSLVGTLQERYKNRLGEKTARELDKFFAHVKVTHVLIASAVLAGLLGWATGSWVFGIALLAGGLFVPKIALSIRKQIRSSQVEASLMDALILMNNALRSGLDISTGIELVTTNMAPPISEEFGLVLNAYRLGASLDSALMEMMNRVSSRPLETAISAIIIQRETGGNLIKTFEQLVQTIREESKLQKKVRAFSAQGRTQIAFLALFPWLLACLFYFISPDMFRPALEDPLGQAILMGLIVWEGVGLIVTKRIVTVEV
jgi:tight adherence protein B